MRNACISLILLPLPITIPQPSEISMPKSPCEAEYSRVDSLLEVCQGKKTHCVFSKLQNLCIIHQPLFQYITWNTVRACNGVNYHTDGCRCIMSCSTAVEINTILTASSTFYALKCSAIMETKSCKYCINTIISTAILVCAWWITSTFAIQKVL